MLFKKYKHKSKREEYLADAQTHYSVEEPEDKYSADDQRDRGNTVQKAEPNAYGIENYKHCAGNKKKTKCYSVEFDVEA